MKRAFTLIETAAVIAILALLSGSVVLSLAHTVSRHRFEALCQQLQEADGLVRGAARQSGVRQQLIFDLDGGAVMWQQPGESSPLRMVQLSQSKILQVVTADQAFQTGSVTVDCSPNGFSESYALQIESSSHQLKWMIVAGLSGQLYWTTHDTQVDQILQSLQSRLPRLSAVQPEQGYDAD